MNIRFYHNKCYDWETIKPSDAKEGDLLAKNAKGDTTRRIVIDSPYTDVGFSGGGLEAIHNERAAAGLGKKSDIAVVTQHLDDAVIPNHFDAKDVIGITCDDPVLEKQLQAYYAVKGAPNEN